MGPFARSGPSSRRVRTQGAATLAGGAEVDFDFVPGRAVVDGWPSPVRPVYRFRAGQEAG